MLWQQDAVTIYGVPQRSASLAHVIPPAAIARRDALDRYVAALDDPSLPAAEIRRVNFHEFRVSTSAQPDQVISVQTGYHPGWRAWVNGRESDVGRDGLGLLVIHPRCNGPCEIEMIYDGGLEYKLCRAVSGLTALGLLVYTCGGLFAGWTRRKAFGGLRRM